MGLSVVTPPNDEPLSLDEVKQHLKLDIDDDDELVIAAYLPAVREACENYLSRSLITQTLRQTFDCWPSCMRLEHPPVQSVTSIEYVDDNGVTQTLDPSAYQIDLSSDGPARIMPAYGEVWPSVRPDTFNAVTVTFVAGYADQASVPGPIRSAMLLFIAHLYENRSAINIGNIVNELPLAVRFLLDPHRVLYV